MSQAVKSFVAAGIVGAVVWAFKREADRAAEQGQGATVQPVSLPTVTRKGFDFSKAFNTILDAALNEPAPTATPSRTSSIFSRLKSTTAPSVPAGGGVRALLVMIGKHESRNNYNIVYSGSRIRTPKPLVQMTVAEVRAWQDRSVRAGSKSSAVGYYQIIRETMDHLIGKGALHRDELFNEAAQDRAGVALLNRRGLASYQSGRITAEQFAQNLAMEWASFPAITRDQRGRPATGQSYYAEDGLNRSLTSRSQVMAAVRAI